MASQQRSFNCGSATFGTALKVLVAAICLSSLLCVGSTSLATIVASADPEDGFGPEPDGTAPDLVFLTVDSYAEDVAQVARRGVAADRRLRQTFQIEEGFNVGGITIAWDGEATADAGMKIRFYEVDDTLATPFTAGDLVKELNFSDTVPNSAEILRLDLTGGDVFRLPARGGEGDPSGYAIEFSTLFSLPSDNSIGQVVHIHDEVDRYEPGAFYTETDGISGGVVARDLGIGLIDTDQQVFIPGDTNGDDIVDVEIDLAAIAAHFRQNVTSTEEGDLDGNSFVDFIDFDIWKRHFPGTVPASALGFLTVPEPGSGLLLLAGLLGSQVTCRRRSSSASC